MNPDSRDSIDSALTIELDGQAHAVPKGSTLADIVAALGHAEQAVATAVNHHFIARSQRAQTPLHTGDQVMLFQPIVGG
jgi:sulfur carrier protein